MRIDSKEMILEVSKPFTSVFASFLAGHLSMAKPIWSDFPGDQDHIPVLKDASGNTLLTISDFRKINEAICNLNNTQPVS